MASASLNREIWLKSLINLRSHQNHAKYLFELAKQNCFYMDYIVLSVVIGILLLHLSMVQKSQRC